MQFSALNRDDVDKGAGNASLIHPNNAPEQQHQLTKEAIESKALLKYRNALSFQNSNKTDEAKMAYREILASPYISEILQGNNKEVSTEILKGTASRLRQLCLQNLARIHESCHQYAACIDYCIEALTTDDSNSMLWYRLGRVALSEYKLQLSAYSLNQVIIRSPEIYPAWRLLITVLFALFQFQKCLNICADLVEVCPNDKQAIDISSWIIKHYKYIDIPKNSEIEAISRKRDFLHVEHILASRFVKEALDLKLRNEDYNKFNLELEEWLPTALLTHKTWVSVGSYLLETYSEAEERNVIFHRTVINRTSETSHLKFDNNTLQNNASSQIESGCDSNLKQDLPRKSNKRRPPEQLEDAFIPKRRSSRRSQYPMGFTAQPMTFEYRELLRRHVAPRWTEFYNADCLQIQPISLGTSRRSSLTEETHQWLLLTGSDSLQNETAQVESFLLSNNLLPIHDILCNYLLQLSKLFLCSWPEEANPRLQTILVDMYAICNMRYIHLPHIPIDCEDLTSNSIVDVINKGYVVLMVLEILLCADKYDDGIISQPWVTEHAYYIERICYSRLLPPEEWYSFILRAGWAISKLYESQGLYEHAMLMLQHCLQVFHIWKSSHSSELETPDAQELEQLNETSDSEWNEQTHRFIPSNELIVAHPNIQSYISQSAIESCVDKIALRDSSAKLLLMHSYVTKQYDDFISSINPYLCDTPGYPFSYLLLQIDFERFSDFTPNLIHLTLESMRASTLKHFSDISNKLLFVFKNLTLLIKDFLSHTQSSNLDLVAVIHTLDDFIAYLLCIIPDSDLLACAAVEINGYIWCLTNVIQFHWELKTSPVKRLLPIVPAICTMFHIIRKVSTDCIKLSDLHDIKLHNHNIASSFNNNSDIGQTNGSLHNLNSNNTKTTDSSNATASCSDINIRQRLAGLHPSLAFLIDAHDMLGEERICSSYDGLLLHTLLSELHELYVRLKEEASYLKTLLFTEISQVLYCLFGFPSKKAKQLGLSEHKEHYECYPSLHWPSCIIFLSVHRPHVLPAFDDNKSYGISSDLVLVCKRIVTLLAENVNFKVSNENLQSYLACENDLTLDHNESMPEDSYYAFYIVADDYLKAQFHDRAITYYLQYIRCFPQHFDSWAGLVVAKLRQLQDIINKRNVVHINDFHNEIACANTSVEKCFSMVNALNAQHSYIYEKYGHFCYQVTSYYNHLSVFSEASEFFPSRLALTSSIPPVKPLLEKAVAVFDTALSFNGIIAEPWLYHYMLAKIKRKLSYPPGEYLSHLVTSADILAREGADYPSYVDCNSGGFACEVIEVHYILHSILVKLLLESKLDAVNEVESILLQINSTTPLGLHHADTTLIETHIYGKHRQIVNALNLNNDNNNNNNNSIDIDYNADLSPDSEKGRFIRALANSIQGLVVCLARFPTHLKAQFRIAQTLWSIDRDLFYDVIRSLMFGPVGPIMNNEKVLPLFSLKLNLFANMWQLYSYDINRPGSFCYHMIEHLKLLIVFLLHSNSFEVLLNVISLLRMKPESNKMYLREYERIAMLEYAITTCYKQLIACVMKSPSSLNQIKRLGHLKILFILYSIISKTSNIVKQSEFLPKLEELLISIYCVYKGKPAIDANTQQCTYTIADVISFCKTQTNSSFEKNNCKKTKLTSNVKAHKT